MAHKMANWSDIQKSKLGYLEYPRLHLILDEISKCQVPFKPLQMCWKMQLVFLTTHGTPLSAVHSQKWFYHIT